MHKGWIRKGLRIVLLGCSIGILGCDGSDGGGVNGPEGRYEFINTSSHVVHVMPAGDETFTAFSLRPGDETSLGENKIHGRMIEFMYMPANLVNADMSGLDNTTVFVDRSA